MFIYIKRILIQSARSGVVIPLCLSFFLQLNAKVAVITNVLFFSDFSSEDFASVCVKGLAALSL